MIGTSEKNLEPNRASSAVDCRGRHDQTEPENHARQGKKVLLLSMIGFLTNGFFKGKKTLAPFTMCVHGLERCKY